MKYLNLIFIVVLFICACTDDLELKQADLSDYDEFDTTEVIKTRDIFILNGIYNAHLGNFSMTRLIVKNCPGNKKLVYKMVSNEDVEISKSYIAITNNTKSDYGWFTLRRAS